MLGCFFFLVCFGGGLLVCHSIFQGISKCIANYREPYRLGRLGRGRRPREPRTPARPRRFAFFAFFFRCGSGKKMQKMQSGDPRIRTPIRSPTRASRREKRRSSSAPQCDAVSSLAVSGRCLPACFGRKREKLRHIVPSGR